MGSGEFIPWVVCLVHAGFALSQPIALSTFTLLSLFPVPQGAGEQVAIWA